MADIEGILAKADELGQLLSKHPTVEKYREAQKGVSQDPEANRLLGEFEKQYEKLVRQQESGMPVTDAQRSTLEALQQQIASHLKIQAFNLAQYEFIDMLRRVSQAYQKHLSDALGGEAALGGGRPGAGGASPILGG